LLSEIADSGGEIMLIIHLPGDENMGDMLSLREMKRLCTLHISLGVEVFPEFSHGRPSGRRGRDRERR
jgi:hypothetical protein